MGNRKRIEAVKVGCSTLEEQPLEYDDVMTIEEFTEWVRRVTNLNK